MDRRRKDLQGLDISLWVAVDTNALSIEMRAAFCIRRGAVERYATGETVRAIEKQTGITARQLYRLLDRCLKESDDGTLLGFRGMIKHQRVGTYRRVMRIRAVDIESGSGLVGAFVLLMERYPALVTWLRQQLSDHAVLLRQLGTEGRLRTRLTGLGALHQRFLQQCRSVGITAADYPLNTERMGIRSLCSYVKAEMLRGFGAAAYAAGARRLKGLPRGDEAIARAAVRISSRRVRWTPIGCAFEDCDP